MKNYTTKLQNYLLKINTNNPETFQAFFYENEIKKTFAK